MVSAVFHSPSDSVAPATAPVAVSRPAAPAPEAKAKAPRDAYDWRGLALRVLPPAISIALLIGLWALATMKGGSFPTPAATFARSALACATLAFVSSTPLATMIPGARTTGRIN